MPSLPTIPLEVLDYIIERLVAAFDIQKVVILRATCRIFDKAVIRAICFTQARLSPQMSPTFRARIADMRARTGNHRSSYIIALINVNEALDSLIGDCEPELTQSRHEFVAGTLLPNPLVEGDPVDPTAEAQNVLSAAAAIGNLSVVKSQISQEHARADGFTPFFHEPLILAAAHGHLEVTRYLLQNGASSETTRGFTCEYRQFAGVAAWNSDPLPVDRSISLFRGLSNALRSAVLGRHECIVQLLLHPHYRPPLLCSNYLEAIKAGACSGRLDLIKMILQVIGKPVSDFPKLGDVMMLLAVRYNHRTIVEWLLDTDIKIDVCVSIWHSPYPGPLALAASRGHLDIVQFLLDRGADINFNETGWEEGFAIGEAARRSHLKVVELLLKYGADPSVALVVAARFCRSQVIALVLSRYPDLLKHDGYRLGRRALQEAIFSGKLDSITLLVDAGVPLEPETSIAEYTLLSPMFAAKLAGQHVVDHLIALGAEDTGDRVPGMGFLAVRGVRA